MILVVYRSLIDGGYSHETTPLAGPRASSAERIDLYTLLAGPSCRVLSAERIHLQYLRHPRCLSLVLATPTFMQGRVLAQALALTSTLYKVGCPWLSQPLTSNPSCSFVTSFEYIYFIIILQIYERSTR